MLPVIRPKLELLSPELLQKSPPTPMDDQSLQDELRKIMLANARNNSISTLPELKSNQD